MSKGLKVRNWWDEADPGLIIGARPNAEDARALYELGVRAVVNTCEEYAGPLKVYDELKIDQLHIPTIDFTHPHIDDVENAVKFISQHVNNGNRVYVHCKAGRARSATVALCWLVDFRKMHPQAAQKHLVDVRHQVNRRLLKRPVVREFMRRRKIPLH